MFLSLVFSPEHKNVFCNSCYFNKNYIFASLFHYNCAKCK